MPAPSNRAKKLLNLAVKNNKIKICEANVTIMMHMNQESSYLL